MAIETTADIMRVPFASLSLIHRDVEVELELAWREALNESAFIGGPRVKQFEQEWADYCGVNHAVGVANGTDAIEITLRALGIGGGDEVILPANTFIATAEAIVMAGARPRFVDVDPETLLITPDAIRDAIGPRTAAVISVALYGNMPRMTDIAQLASARGLALIEDAAQAIGSTWDRSRAGSFGVAGCFSFYPGKNLGALGDAGAIVTNDPNLADRARSLANHGQPAGDRYAHDMLGRNSRLDSIQAAFLSAKLPMLDYWNEARRSVVEYYSALLDRGLARLVRIDDRAGSTYHLLVARVDDRDAIRAGLTSAGIETGVHYPIPCHFNDPYRQFATEPLPVAERAASEVLSLPLFPHMTHEQVEYVAERFNDLVSNRGAGGG